jgi:hypothetical protein
MSILLHIALAAVVDLIALPLSLWLARPFIREWEMGTVKNLALKCALVVLAATPFSFITCGILFSAVVWLFAFIAVFRFPFQDAWIVTWINWGVRLALWYGLQALIELFEPAGTIR